MSHTKERLDAYIEAMMIVARASGTLEMKDFNAETWKMLCQINRDLAAAASAEADKLASR